MSDKVKLSIVDQPLQGGENDGLKTELYRKGLCKFIEQTDTPITVALQGEWGSGKTSLMNALKNELCDQKGKQFFPVWINTWHHSMMANAELSVVSILQAMIEQLCEGLVSEKKNDTWRKFVGFGKRIGKVIAVNAGNVAGGMVGMKTLGTDVANAAKSNEEPSETGVAELKGSIESLITDLLNERKKDGVIFFIDDLDRIDPPVAVQILELLKNIFDIKNCVFVLAIDYDVVVKGLKSKFGEMTAANEREFRSFFDKIIQLPFSMPVNAYQIDDFLIGNLRKIEFITDAEASDKELKRTLTDFAQMSVGRNPRSLKRLMNTLSLIQIMSSLKEKSNDDTPAEAALEKKLNFALVCLQVCYPAIYNLLTREPSFKEKWNDSFATALELPELTPAEKDRFKNDENFDEAWEQLLYRVCQKSPFLKQHALDISRLLNKIAAMIVGADESNGEKRPDSEIGDYVRQVIELSSVTNVTTSENAAAVKIVDFNAGEYVRQIAQRAIPMANQAFKQKFGAATYLKNIAARIRTTGHFMFWEGDNFERRTPMFDLRVNHDATRYFAEVSTWCPILIGYASIDEGEQKLNCQGRKTQLFDSLRQCVETHGGEFWSNPDVPSECCWHTLTARIYYASLDELSSDMGMSRFANFIVEYMERLTALDEIRGNTFVAVRDSLRKYVEFKKMLTSFKSCWIYENKTLVLDNWKLDGDELAIDVRFDDGGHFDKVSVQIFSRKKNSAHVREVREKFGLDFPDEKGDRLVRNGLTLTDIIPFIDRELGKLPH